MPHSLDQRIAEEILDKHFEAFSKKHYERILDRLEIDEDALKGAIELIVRLNPRPGNTARDTNKPSQEIIPDFAVMAIDGQLELSLNGRNAPELRVSRQYRDMIKEYARNKKDKDAKEALQFIKQKLDSAKWFIDAIKQRQNTLLVTMEAIMEHQREFFLTGDETKLKPMILKDIAGTRGPGHQHHQPRGQQQVRADQLRHLPAEVLLQRKPDHEQWRGGEHARSEEDPEGRHRGGGEAQAAHRRRADRAAEGARATTSHAAPWPSTASN